MHPSVPTTSRMLSMNLYRTRGLFSVVMRNSCDRRTAGIARVAVGMIVALSCCLVTDRVSGQQFVVIEQAEAIEKAKEVGLPIAWTDAQGTSYSLQKFRNGIPQYYKTFNSNAAASISTNRVYPGGIGGLSLTGTGVRLGIWDAGRVRTTHAEFTTRAIQRDTAFMNDAHATHVAGTMIAVGANPSAKGMSYEATLDAYDWDLDQSEMRIAAANALRVSNHSYGLVTGWAFFCFFQTDCSAPRGAIPVCSWVWFGDVRVSEVEDHHFGYYSEEAKDWDKIAHDNPRYLWVKAAGNDRNEGPAPNTPHYYFNPFTYCLIYNESTRSLDGNNGYDSISHSACSKNGLTVGAVQDVSGGYQGPTSVVMSSFSCWGPTDDGRIKPDIVGNGVGLFSSTAASNTSYASFSGTSMASPNVSGSLGLLIQHWRDTHPGDMDMWSSTLKGLVIHTADECGDSPGPDYRFGWGLMNTLKAANLITVDQSQPLTITENTLADGEVFELYIYSDASSPELRATICWTDPPPTVQIPFALDPTTKVLVNDLDLRISSSQATFQPWVLNVASPANAATRGDNDVDNVEQIVIPNSVSDAFHLRVSHKGSLVDGSQAFSLIISGAQVIRTDPEFAPPLVLRENPPRGAMLGALPQVSVTFDEPVFGVLAGDLSVNGSAASSVTGSGAGPYVFSGFALPPDGSVAVQLSAGQVKDVFENPFAGNSWNYIKQDCNNNGVHDQQDISAGFSKDCNTNGIPDECDPAALKLNPPPTETISYGQLLNLGGSGLVTGGVLPYTYQWTLRGNSGEETTGSDSPVFSPDQPGTYVLRVVVTDAIGCSEITYVTVIVTESDAELGSIPMGPITVGGPFCPIAGGMTFAAMLVTFGGWRLIRRGRSKRAKR